MGVLVVISKYSSSKQLKVNWNVEYIALDSVKRNSNTINNIGILSDTFSPADHCDCDSLCHPL